MTFNYGYLRLMDAIKKFNYNVTLPKFHNFITTEVFRQKLLPLKYALVRAKIINPCVEMLNIIKIFKLRTYFNKYF